MTLEWQHEARCGVAVLRLTGYLGERAIDKFAGAIGWALARGTGPIILDLTDLHGWSAEGETAVLDAATRLALHNRPLTLCGPRLIAEPMPKGNPCEAITVYPDIETALATLGSAPNLEPTVPPTSDPDNTHSG
ncbi:STAS domain-containing protein [Actinopolymorpha alba]|uniref:STAS domain-containing protein n=1 Tax=Actinopolymorpha alba TaxID=533267 RepID=UPI000374AF03|nr:STAS domain-containing protein [Actinopolymorpha alba]